MDVNIAVKLNSVRLTNFRLFEDIEVKFHDKLTVLIGQNGAGKTSLLEGLVPLLTLFVQKIRGQSLDLKTLYTPYNIRYGTVEAVNMVSLLVNNEIELQYFVTLNEDDGYVPDEASDTQSFNKLDDLARSLSEALKNNAHEKEKKDVAVPVLAYYPCVEAQDWEENEPNKKTKNNRRTPYSTYDDSLTRRSFSFQDFFQWFKWRENIDKQTGEDPFLEITRQAIYSMLNDSEKQVFYNLHTDYRQAEEGELVMMKGEDQVVVNRLSSGEKAMFALVSDLARRLIIANEYKPNPLEGNGIVLIDEIDLHLHPSWQRKVIPQLQKIFPNLQFIVTTHSPLVISTVDRECILILSNGKALSAISFSKGRDATSLLSDYFGIENERPPELTKKVEEFYELLNKGRKADAEQILEELKEIWGESDEEIIRAESFFEIY